MMMAVHVSITIHLPIHKLCALRDEPRLHPQFTVTIHYLSLFLLLRSVRYSGHEAYPRQGLNM